MRIGALTNRAARIQEAFDWIDGIIEAFYVTEDAINAATTVDEALAVTWDFSSFGATDPLVTIREVRDIPD